MQIVESSEIACSNESTLCNVPPTVARSYGDRLPAGLRPIYVYEYPDGSGFVFNAEHPSGVRYLARHAFAVYRNLLGTEGKIPTVDEYNGALYADFIKLGIARSRYAAKQRTAARSHPRHFSVWLHIVNACNLSCRYCYIPNLQRMADADSATENVMSATTIERSTASLFEFCKVSGFQSVLIKFAGGEPALCGDQIRLTCEIANRCAEHSGVAVKFAMLSNGVLLDEQVCEVLVQNRIAVSISVDGDIEAHNDVRFKILNSESDDGCRSYAKVGTWDLIDKNVRYLMSIGIRPYFMCTVTGRNYDRLSGLFRYTMSNRIGVRLSMVRDSLSHLRPGLQHRILEELVGIYAWLGESMPADMPIERFAAFGDWEPGVKKEAICSACRTYAAIDHRGNVASCQMRLGSSNENLLETSFSQAFSRVQGDTENLYLIRPSAKSGDCSRCYWKYICAGGCPEHTRSVVGSSNAPSPWCELFHNLLPHYLNAIALQRKRRMDMPQRGATDGVPGKFCAGRNERQIRI